jgi:predicted RNA-binding Zn-ribbon protein involved in translation (DUF1610 family)
MRKELSYEDVLRKLSKEINEDLEYIDRLHRTRFRGALYYCPQCLNVELIRKSKIKFFRKRNITPVCQRCGSPMKPLDSSYKDLREKISKNFYEKTKTFLEKSWEILRSCGEDIHYSVSSSDVAINIGDVFSDNFISLRMYVDRQDVKAFIYMSRLEQKDLDNLMSLIKILRDEDVHGVAEVDKNGCKISDEEMTKLGFYRVEWRNPIPMTRDWHLEF